MSSQSSIEEIDVNVLKENLCFAQNSKKRLHVAVNGKRQDFNLSTILILTDGKRKWIYANVFA